MKYCTKCGNELMDYAAVCTKCGCLVGGARKLPKSVKPTREQEGGNSIRLSATFNFVSDLLDILSAFLLFVSIACIYISCSNYANRCYAYYDSEAAVLALLVSIVSLGMAIASFVIALVRKDEEMNLFASIKKLAVTLALVILSIVFIG